MFSAVCTRIWVFVWDFGVDALPRACAGTLKQSAVQGLSRTFAEPDACFCIILCASPQTHPFVGGARTCGPRLKVTHKGVDEDRESRARARVCDRAQDVRRQRCVGG
eukprot:1032651-Rhodomonas_salina.1